MNISFRIKFRKKIIVSTLESMTKRESKKNPNMKYRIVLWIRAPIIDKKKNLNYF